MKAVFQICTMFAICFSIVLIFTSTSYAASSPPDPLVAIVKDTTSSTHCSGRTTLNVGTPKQTAVHYACPSGSIIAVETVSLSQALAQHESYVVLPSQTSSPQTKEKAKLQIQQLEATVQKNSVLHSVHASILPSIACGSTAIPSRDWNAGGESMHTYVEYYKSSDCSTIYITVSGVQNNSSNTYIYWSHDQYASWSGYVNNCPYIPAYTNLTVNWNTTQAPGYYYEHWLNDNYCVIGGNTYYENILLN